MLDFSHTDLTDLTDFDSFGVLPLRDQMRIPVACNEKESVRSVRSVWEDKKKAGRMSKHPFRAMN